MLTVLFQLPSKLPVRVIIIILVLIPTLATAQDDNTRTLVIHSLHTTAEIPPDWQLTPDGMYVGQDGEQLGFGIVPWTDGMTIDDACQEAANFPAIENGALTFQIFERSGQPACKIETSPQQNLTALVIQHPYPFEVPVGGRVEFVVYWSDADHFDAITASLDFAPENVRPADYMEAVLDFAQTNSYYRDRVNWDPLRTFILSGLEDETDLISVQSRMNDMVTVLRGTGDNHTIYFSPEMFELMFAVSPTAPNVQLPAGKRLTETVGYIQLPGILGYNQVLREYAQAGQAVIRQVDEHPAACWIIDLRGNWGGHMLPMLQAVAPILGDGLVEQFVGGSGEDTLVSLQDGIVFYDQIQAPDFIEANYHLQQPNPPVALLIGPRTGSAGENTAIAFIGRPQTRLFGQHSARLTIGNTGLLLFDDGALTLAAGVSADRNGNRYPNGIAPDVTIKEDTSAFDSPENPVIAAALDWLTEQGC